MRTFLPFFIAVTALLGQDAAKPAKEVRFYRVDFVLKELEEGKILSLRTHQAQLAGESGTGPVTIRSGSRIPYASGQNLQYADIGTNIDCRPLNDGNNQFTMNISAEVSSVITAADGQMSNTPVVRQNRWSGLVSVPLSKSTILFYSDDPNSRRRMQLEATVTPIK